MNHPDWTGSTCNVQNNIYQTNPPSGCGSGGSCLNGGTCAPVNPYNPSQYFCNCPPSKYTIFEFFEIQIDTKNVLRFV